MPEAQPTSRDSLEGAGWRCARPGRFAARIPPGRRPFSWLSPAPLVHSRNDRLARIFDDPTNDERRRWLSGPAGRSDPVIDHTGSARISFLVMGDTGEGDASQYAVVEPLLARAEGTAFMLICSDVIYPAGEIAEYGEKFFRPYQDYPGPIYAIPGNHDWYDNLVGFMFHFCGREAPPPRPRSTPLSKTWLRDLLWRRPKAPDPAEVAEMRKLRDDPGQQARQPGPYFVIETEPVRLVAIDTGITGVLDRDQGEWLRRVSAESAKPKILLTGKPLYVDAKHRRGTIEGGGTVDEVVRAPEHNYVAAIGGDIHNYQRYPVSVDERRIQYIVSGAGGAFMHATHRIPKVELPGVTEADFRCYPRRGDSLSFYSQLYDKKFGFGKGLLYIPPDQAAALLAEELEIEPTRPDARRVIPSARSRRAGKLIASLPGRGRGALHLPFSEFFDWNDPPLFKSFLRIDASEREIRIGCYGATGCQEQEDDPPLEDAVTASRTDAGRWEWREETG